MRIEVKGYSHEKHYELLLSWWKHRGLPGIPKDDLPSVGFMSYWEDKPLMSAFLTLTNVNYCLFGTFCANPETHHEDREAALSALSEAASEIAKGLGFKRMVCIPAKDRLAAKLSEVGWTDTNQRLYLFNKEL